MKSILAAAVLILTPAAFAAELPADVQKFAEAEAMKACKIAKIEITGFEKLERDYDQGKKEVLYAIDSIGTYVVREDLISTARIAISVLADESRQEMDLVAIESELTSLCN